MEHAADTWPEHAHDERRTARLLAALAVSVLCHATVLLLVRGWRLEADVAPPLVVTMVTRGSGGPGDGAASGPEGAAVEPAPAPVAVVAAPPTRPVPERVPARRPIAPTTRAAAPAVESAAPVAARDESPALTTGGADAGAAGAGATVASAGSGSGQGGSGGGNGSRNDGLRAFCARCPAPAYPGRARRQGWQGTVDVELAIARDGAVTEARIGRSSGYPTLDEVALDVARQSRFTVPTEGDGLRGQLRYRFVLDETTARR